MKGAIIAATLLIAVVSVDAQGHSANRARARQNGTTVESQHASNPPVSNNNVLPVKKRREAIRANTSPVGDEGEIRIGGSFGVSLYSGVGSVGGTVNLISSDSLVFNYGTIIGSSSFSSLNPVSFQPLNASITSVNISDVYDSLLRLIPAEYQAQLENLIVDSRSANAVVLSNIGISREDYLAQLKLDLTPHNALEDSLTSPSTAAVPEPSSIAFGALAIVLTATRVSRRSKT